MALPTRLAVLTLNCQWGHRSALAEYLNGLLRSGKYDFLLLQDTTPAMHRALRSRKYSVLTPPKGPQERMCIVYRKGFRLARSSFLSFQQFVRFPTEQGALAGVFSVKGASWLVCTAHLHHGTCVITRRREISALKEFLARTGGGRPTIIGGDFNCMVPGEPRLIARQMRPEFRHCTTYRGHSHDMKLLERGSLVNDLVVFAAHIFPSRTRLDHIFISAAAPYRTSCAVHDVTVSDHRPVSVELRKTALDTSTRG